MGAKLRVLVLPSMAVMPQFTSAREMVIKNKKEPVAYAIILAWYLLRWISGSLRVINGLSALLLLRYVPNCRIDDECDYNVILCILSGFFSGVWSSFCVLIYWMKDINSVVGENKNKYRLANMNKSANTLLLITFFFLNSLRRKMPQ